MNVERSRPRCITNVEKKWFVNVLMKLFSVIAQRFLAGLYKQFVINGIVENS